MWLENLGQELGKRYLGKQSQKRWRYLYLMLMLTKGWHHNTKTNNQVDRMINLWMPARLFPQSSSSSVKNKVSMVAGTEVIHGCSSLDSYLPTLTW
jgi:hypothetical protein